jgi:hypothetical protein
MNYKITYVAILSLINLNCQDNRIVKYQVIFNNQLKPWTSTYSNFRLTDFKLVKKEKFESNYKQDFKLLNSFYSIYKPILTFSMDSSSFIDIYSYGLNLSKKGDVYEAFPDVDQAIILCDIKSKYWNRICFGNPGLYFEEAFWIDNAKFMLLARETNGKNERPPCIFIGDENIQELMCYKNINSLCIQRMEVTNRINCVNLR